MAIFRKIHTSMWGDSFFSELSNDKKLFYMYLLTNERTKQCGIYEITKRQIMFDLGYTLDRVSILLKFFSDNSKIRYNEATSELALKNWLKYNASTSPKVQACVNKEFASVKDTLLIQYIKGIDTRSQQEEEQEEEQDQIKPNDSIIEKLNSFDSKILDICKWFISQLDEKASSKISNKNKLSWCETIEKCNRIDGFSFERIFEIVKTIKLDSFWNSNFMSIRKLRERKTGDELTFIFRWDAKLNSPTIPTKESYEDIVSRTMINKRQTF